MQYSLKHLFMATTAVAVCAWVGACVRSNPALAQPFIFLVATLALIVGLKLWPDSPGHVVAAVFISAIMLAGWVIVR